MTELYAPDVEWRWSRQARILRSRSDSYRGLPEIGAAMREWVSDWGLFRLSAKEFIDAGDHVVVLSEVYAELKGGRGEVNDRQADVITVRERRKPRRRRGFGERMMGLEPTTFCMASRRSSQLSYIRMSA